MGLNQRPAVPIRVIALTVARSQVPIAKIRCSSGWFEHAFMGPGYPRLRFGTNPPGPFAEIAPILRDFILTERAPDARCQAST